jgi:hypothetical protein
LGFLIKIVLIILKKIQQKNVKYEKYIKKKEAKRKKKMQQSRTEEGGDTFFDHNTHFPAKIH